MILNMGIIMAKKWQRICVITLFTILPILFASGCGMQFRTGRLPDVNNLRDLTISVSTKADVLEKIGTPRSTGRVMFPHEDSPKDLWCYYYEESTLSESQRFFLFVFFNQERYTGYMWFSSLPQFTAR